MTIHANLHFKYCVYGPVMVDFKTCM